MSGINEIHFEDTEFLNRLSKDKGLANYVVGQFFHLLMKDLKDDTINEYKKEDGDLPVAAEP